MARPGLAYLSRFFPFSLQALNITIEQYIMPRSDEAASFFFAVYSAVQEVPYGKVTSYGHIAALIGTRKFWLFFF